MHSLMQDTPLTLQMVLRRVEQLYGSKMVSTRREHDTLTTSYADMVERINRLAGALAELGVRPGDRVATFGWNSQRHLELYMAVPCMGAVLHTLNIRLHHEQVTYIANHAEDQVVFVDASAAEAWNAVKDLTSVRHVVVMDDVSEEGRGATPVEGAHDYEDLLDAASPSYAWPELDERQAAAMCYTSGTTGNPKGVVYGHRSSTLHALGTLFADTVAMSERENCLVIVPQFHANAWGMPYGALMTGANLVMTGRFMDPESVVTLVEEQEVTFSAAVPTVWFGVLQAIRNGTIDADRLRTLERLVVGGSAVPESLMKGYDELGVTIIHAWGMTETSPLGSVAKVKSNVPESETLRTRLTQGLVTPTLDIRIVTDDGQVGPWDGKTAGELQISGPWIADAYYDPEAENGRGGQDKFVEDETGRRWLQTGDVANVDPEGYIKLVDRTKDLVKSGGEWISTVDLENLLMTHEKVTEAAVIAVPSEKWDERPLACVVAADDSVTKDELLSFIGEHYAKWQVPDDVVFIDEVPKTSVGKFDKKVLRKQYAEDS